MKKFLLIFILLMTIPFRSAFAQADEGLSISLRRDFGYSSGTGKIQGTFTIKATGPDDLNRVIFLIDSDRLGEDQEPPFQTQFRTGDFPLGVHTLQAIGYRDTGEELNSNLIRNEFVSAEAGFQSAIKILLPILALVLGGMLISYLLPSLVGRRKHLATYPGNPPNYGPFGAAICPRCSRPFARHIWGLNLVVGKFDRCPHCGRWSLVGRASPQALRAAELAEQELAKQSNVLLASPDEERLRKDIEDSRYQDL